MMVGFWLVYRGYERQQALARTVDGALATPGQVDAVAGRTPTSYYLVGALLIVSGAYRLSRART